MWTGHEEMRPQDIQRRGQQRRKGDYTNLLHLLRSRSSSSSQKLQPPPVTATASDWGPPSGFNSQTHMYPDWPEKP